MIGFGLATFVAIWAIEPRVFMYLFQRLAYPVNERETFIADIDRVFPHHALVEQNLALLKRDLISLLRDPRIPKAHEMDELNGEISFATGPGWRTYYLKVYSGWFETNCQRCPDTYALFRNMDDVLTVMFSIMEPGNTIPPHRGKLRGFLRYQLPLIVPASGTCAITVNGETRAYKEGHAILFDDVLPHHVVNHTPEYRAVLFLDVRKPANAFVRFVDDICMKLVCLSPKFRAAAGRAFKEF